MRIGDSAPSALLRAPASPVAGGDFLRTFGSVQRAYRARRPPALYEIPERQERQRQFEARAQRLQQAARSLENSAPSAEYEVGRETTQDVKSVATTREVTTQREVRSDATPARQASVAFGDPDAKIAKKDSKLQLKINGEGPKIRIRVGKDGASLNEIAQLINDDHDNNGRVEASVVNAGDGFRLKLETTATGSGANIAVTRDDFKTPSGQKFKLIDANLAETGKDESVEIVKETELVAGTRRTVRTREIETRQQVDDAEFASQVAEFAAAYNELRSFAHDERLDVGDDSGLVGNDQRVQQVLSALDELASSLAERSSESGASLGDLGISLDEGGSLSLDTEALQNAIASDTTSVVQLLNSAEGGLGSATSQALAPPEVEATDPVLNMRGFLSSLASQEGRLEARAGLLEDVVSALSQGPTGE